MRTTVKLPNLSEAVSEVMVLEWLCGVGDRVKAGDPLVTVETDKVDTEIPSPVSGVVVDLLVHPEEEIETGAAICVIEAKFEGVGTEGAG
jgi:pyruvate/2-oxoglutarate dehydrogenase complex dihydrolipoamide acyltransferase (E2) component